MKRHLALCLVGIVLVAPIANAGVTITSYKAAKAHGGREWTTMRIYINGLATAYMYANIDLEQSKRQKIYCKPELFSLMNDHLIELLDTNIADARLALPENLSVEGVLLQE
jgi:hypothetical protein